MITLNDSQEEILHSIIDAYENDEVEEISVVDVAKRSGISVELAEQILVQLEGLRLIKRRGDGVIIEADNNGYFPCTRSSMGALPEDSKFFYPRVTKNVYDLSWWQGSVFAWYKR
jgi:hypothetical protein